MSDLNEIECGQLCQSTIESLYEATVGLGQFPGLLKKVIQNEAWKRRTAKGKVIELSSLRELITEKPIRGWGEDPKKVEAVIRDDPEVLAMFRGAMKEQTHDRGNQYTGGKHNNVMEANATQGNSRAYSIDRVKRDAPEYLEAVLKKEMSPNAALVKAGIRENRQLYIPKDPGKVIEKLRERFGDEFVQAVIDSM